MIVEGQTDEQFIQAAAVKCRCPDLVRDLYISPAGGADKAVLQAVVMKAQTANPVLVLLDDDPPGKEAYKLLAGRFGFLKSKELLSYREVVGDNNIGAEAEDLFAPALIDAFVKEMGEETAIKSKVLRKEGGWRYDLSPMGKDLIGGFVAANGRPDDFSQWMKLIGMVRERLGVGLAPVPEATAAVEPADDGARPTQWGWAAYSKNLNTSAERIQVGRALIRAVEAAMEAEGLVCSVRFRKGYVAVQRHGGYNVILIDVYFKQPVRLALKLPDDPDALGLANPYPELGMSWTPAWREWGWTVPTVARVPDLAPLMPLVRRFHYRHEEGAGAIGPATERPVGNEVAGG